MSFLDVERPVPLAALPSGRSVVIESIASISMPAMVQESAWRRATIVRSMLVKFPSSITGLEAKVGSSGCRIEFAVARSKRHCNARDPVAGVWRVYLL